MKKIFQAGLGTTLLVALGFLFNIHVASCTSGSGTDSNPPGPGANPKNTVVNPVTLQAGTSVTFECADKKCATAFATSGATDSNPGNPNPKVIFQCTLPVDIPANTVMLVRFGPQGDSAARRKEGAEK